MLNNLVLEMEILPPLPSDEFYQITRGYVRLNGNAPESGTHKVDIVTNDESLHLLAEIPSAFFGTNNNTDLIDVFPHNTTPIHFSSGLKITTNSAMVFEAGTSLTVNLVYRIIKL